MAPLFEGDTAAPQPLSALLLLHTSVAVATLSEYFTTTSVLNKGSVIENQGENW